ncbi:hypothetical protein HXX02_00195 [Microbulbifer elongatus]|uniref:Lipoprotein n=1 Tax=Microbulbifer elongatus TaxID=86173 RepID=A0ABT1NVI2_9GAMM|nr:hypothetical protein [Microbulbifer elongatus]MCQ3827855.1 hypothetical protein [Microbulbifer elongatus]
MKFSTFVFLLISSLMSGCTVVGMILDKKINDFENRDKSVLEKKRNDHSNLKSGFEADKKIVKAILESTGGKDGEGQVSDRNVPTHCRPPSVQVCSAKENLCICTKDGKSN